MSPAWLSLPPSMVLGQILALSTEAAWRPELWIPKLASNPTSGTDPEGRAWERLIQPKGNISI